MSKDLEMAKHDTFRKRLILGCVVWAFAGPVVCSGAEDHVANSPDEKPRYVDSVDENGRKDGTFVIPKSRQFIADRLAAIKKMPVKMIGDVSRAPQDLRDALQTREFQSQQEAGLRALAAYRFLCDVPFDDLVIDRDDAAHALAGAKLLAKVGMLTHTPDNPGLPDEEYQFALKGTSSSNICTSNDLPLAIEIFMGDSDATNVDRLGHRRWCLNPAMLKTGFGADKSGYSCMWSMDSSRKNVPDFDFVAYPPRGFIPTRYFKNSYPWSISLNPKKFQKPEPSIKASVTPVRFDQVRRTLRREANPLDTEFLKISSDNFGSGPCVIFRPKEVKIEDGSTFLVTLRGLKQTNGQDAPLEYFVGFFDLGKAERH
jgi:hypothetical protein